MKRLLNFEQKDLKRGELLRLELLLLIFALNSLILKLVSKL